MLDLLDEAGGSDPGHFDQTHVGEVDQNFTGIEFSQKASVNNLLNRPGPIHQIVNQFLFGGQFLF